MASETMNLGFLGWPSYEIDKEGNVWSRKSGTRKKMKPQKSKSGHLMVGLSDNGITKLKSIHRLVLLAYIGPCPERMQCCHWDGDPTNNRISNLRWDTPSANAKDTVRHGKCPLVGHGYTRGEKNNNTRITEDDVREIRRIWERREMSMRAIGRKYKMSHMAMQNIIHRRTWFHVI